jgi:hypothetical protein
VSQADFWVWQGVKKVAGNRKKLPSVTPQTSAGYLNFKNLKIKNSV